MLWLYIALRIVANPLSNVFQKLLTRKDASPLFVIGATHALLALACLPVLLADPPPASGAFWLHITACTVLAVAGNALLVEAVRTSDLSVLGPVNAYKSVVSLLPGLVLLNELPSPAGLVGVALIVAGSYFLVDKEEGGPAANAFVRFFKDRGVQYRLAALVLSAVEAVFLKMALLDSSPSATFAVWSALGFVVALPAALLLYGRQGLAGEVRILRASKGTYLALAVTTGLMQFSTVVILTGFKVAAALALFQTSSLVTALLGWWVFREKNVLRRALASLVMVAGAVLIVLNR